MAMTQKPITTDGACIDIGATAKEARKKVDVDETGTPIHVCGLVSHRDCPA